MASNTIRAITTDYKERILIGPEDVIPKSSWFNFVKVSLLVALTLLLLLAIITLIVAESFVSPTAAKANHGLAIGIVSLVGIILFLLGMLAILKEHLPLILAFSVSMILYLLLFMYSRVITSPGLILLRTFILLLLSVESFCFCIMIRDWRALQISRLNQRLMKEAQMVQYSAMMGLGPPGPYFQGQQLQHQQQQLYSGQTAGYGQLTQHQINQHQRQPSYGPGPYLGTPMAQHRTAIPGGLHGGVAYSGNDYQGVNYSRAQPYGPPGQHLGQPLGPTAYGHHGYGPGGPGAGHYDQNPYITVEDEEENPYAQIGEPTGRGVRTANMARPGVKTTGPGQQQYKPSQINPNPRRY